MVISYFTYFTRQSLGPTIIGIRPILTCRGSLFSGWESFA